MKRRLPIISVAFVVLLGVVFLIYQSKQMENARLLEERKQEVINQLANNLSQFHPKLDAFVDDDYKSIIASKIKSKGICEFNRGLAKNQDSFGNYIVKFDLQNMEVISEKLEVTNTKYSEEWRKFKEENNH